MRPFSYRCPFCNQHATITAENYSTGDFEFSDGNKHGTQIIRSVAVTCPNPDCREFSMRAERFTKFYSGGVPQLRGPQSVWQLVPPSTAKVFPDYIPGVVLADYREACAIRDLSPKASATLARRCIQGMIRDFWGISRSRLVDEIAELEGNVDPKTWSAIDALRKFGNIGAHMEKDIDVVVDVDPGEAELLIGLIETLLCDWYVTRFEREERLKRLVRASAEKDAQRAEGMKPVEGTKPAPADGFGLDDPVA